MEKVPSLEDFTCPICLTVLIEPVTLPCHHSICHSCFQEHVSLTSLACPLCRIRISVWVRKNTKTNTLVDVKLWNLIQKHFPAQVEARLAGREDTTDVPQEVQHRVSEPGAIREEYEKFLEQENEEAIQRKNKEEIASIKLIQQLQEEEKKRQLELEQQQKNVAQEDFLLALHLEQADKAQTSSQQRELQELCAKDEDFARELESVEGRSPQVLTRGAGGPRAMSVSPRGPMDAFLEQKGVIKGNHQPSSPSVLSSSDTNTKLSQGSSTSDSRVPTFKHFLSHHSESESEETSSCRQLHSATLGKENLQGGRQRCGEPSRVRRHVEHSTTARRELQLSPDINSFCGDSRPGPYRTSEEDSSAEEQEEEEENNRVTEKEVKSGDSNNDVLMNNSLFKWEEDKESLAALVSEQQLAEAQLQQELEDRLLAQALQEELNNQTRKVLRTKGSEDEYALRHKRKIVSPFQHQAETRKRICSNNSKRQATLSEVFHKRQNSI